jgi:hypothetical protein
MFESNVTLTDLKASKTEIYMELSLLNGNAGIVEIILNGSVEETLISVSHVMQRVIQR